MSNSNFDQLARTLQKALVIPFSSTSESQLNKSLDRIVSRSSVSQIDQAGLGKYLQHALLSVSKRKYCGRGIICSEEGLKSVRGLLKRQNSSRKNGPANKSTQEVEEWGTLTDVPTCVI